MADVIDFQKAKQAAEDAEPHLDGPAFCAACKYEFHAVAPVGQVSGILCPGCNRYLGVFSHQLIPISRWVCSCGCDLYRLGPGGPMCISCGVTAKHYKPDF